MVQYKSSPLNFVVPLRVVTEDDDTNNKALRCAFGLISWVCQQIFHATEAK